MWGLLHISEPVLALESIPPIRWPSLHKAGTCIEGFSLFSFRLSCSFRAENLKHAVGNNDRGKDRVAQALSPLQVLGSYLNRLPVRAACKNRTGKSACATGLYVFFMPSCRASAR